MAIVFTEDFTGTNGAVWPAARWTTSTVNGVSTIDIQNNSGRISSPANATENVARCVSTMTDVADSEILMSWQQSDSTTAATQYLIVSLRARNGWQASQIDYPQDGVSVRLAAREISMLAYTNVGGVRTALAGGGAGGAFNGAHTVGTGKKWLRMRVTGNAIRLRTWDDGATEPTTWHLDVTHTVTGSGRLYISARNSTTATVVNNSYSDAITVDDLVIPSTGAGTVTQRKAGGQKANSFKATGKFAGLTAGSSQVRLVASISSALTTTPAYSSWVTIDAQGYATAEVTGLQPNTQYYYGWETVNAGDLIATGRGQVKTFPQSATSFQFCIGACHNTNTVAAALLAIKARNPLFFMHMGDYHYYDTNSTDPNAYRTSYETQSNLANLESMLSTVPIAYTYSDHDFAGNGSYGSNTTLFPGAPVVPAVVRQHFPLHDMHQTTASEGIYHSFDIVPGRVMMIVLDTRRYSSALSATDNSSKTRLGATQKQWLKDVLWANKTKLKFIVVTEPWQGAAVAGEDDWTGFSTERAEIASYITTNAITNVVMLAGDMHAVASDNGSGSSGYGGFPLFHAAPLERPASQKGGPYQYGPIPASGTTVISQYGLVTVTDSGGSVANVKFQGYNSADAALLTEQNLNFTLGEVAAPLSPVVVTSSGNTTANASTHSLQNPTWVFQEGDVILLHFMLNQPATITPPANQGWNRITATSTSIASQQQSDWFWKVATSAEDSAAISSWASSTATPGTYQMTIIRNAEWNTANGGPIDVSSFTNAGAAGLAVTWPTITTLGPNRLVIWGVSARDVWSMPALSGGGTTTEIYTRTSGTAGAGAGRTIGGDSEPRPTAGATGTRTATATGTADFWTAHSIAIKPAAVSADQTPPSQPSGFSVSVLGG